MRYWIADGAIDPPTTPTLSQVRARSTRASLSYDLGRTAHNIAYMKSRLFLTYSSFIDYCISFLCIIVTLRRNITNSARRREDAT